jgi:hypothetical protein
LRIGIAFLRTMHGDAAGPRLRPECEIRLEACVPAIDRRWTAMQSTAPHHLEVCPCPLS